MTVVVMELMVTMMMPIILTTDRRPSPRARIFWLATKRCQGEITKRVTMCMSSPDL